MGGRAYRFLSVGNLNVDIVMFMNSSLRPGEGFVADDCWLGVGGAATNYAVAVARLEHRVSLVAIASSLAVKLGFIEMLKELGVDVSYVRYVEGPPSIASVVVSTSDGQRTIVSYRGVASSLSHEQIPREGDHVHFASVNPKLVLDYLSSRPDLTVSYDPGAEAKRSPSRVLDALRSVDIAMLTRQELETVIGSASLEEACRLLKGGPPPRVVVVKMGEKGATAVTREGAVHVESPRVRVVDTTGAGDAFDAGFTVGFAEEEDVEWALRLGVAMGSLKVTLKGSSTMPDRRSAVELAERLTARKLSFDCR